MNKQFLMGMGAGLSIMMMIQDFYGLEGYINHLNRSWVELPWWVGGGFAVMFTWLGRDKTL